MEKTEKELLGLGLIQDSNAEDVIDYFGVEKILDAISDIDIVNHLDSFMLEMVGDDELIEAVRNKKKILKNLDFDDIISYLEEHEYKVIDKLSEENNNLLNNIKNICREIRPKGYIDKEEAKKILCNYIDDWYVKYF